MEIGFKKSFDKAMNRNRVLSQTLVFSVLFLFSGCYTDTSRKMNQFPDYWKLLDIIYQYYPQNISPFDSLYYSSQEWQKLNELYRSGYLYTQASTLVDYCEKTMSNEIFNYEQIDPSFPSYRFQINVEQSSSEDTLITGFDVNISFLAPYYFIYKYSYNHQKRKNRDDFEMKNLSLAEKKLLEEIEQIIKIYLPKYVPIDKTFVFQKVPNIANDSRDFGEVTIFDCLFNTMLDEY